MMNTKRELRNTLMDRHCAIGRKLDRLPLTAWKGPSDEAHRLLTERETIRKALKSLEKMTSDENQVCDLSPILTSDDDWEDLLDEDANSAGDSTCDFPVERDDNGMLIGRQSTSDG